LNSSGKSCPICKSENEATASICVQCGAPLDETPTGIVVVTDNFKKGQAEPIIDHMGSPIDIALIPSDGLGIYVEGEIKPYYVHIYKELIIGRPADATLEAVLDLTDLNAANLGVSKRHVMIQRTASGYEVIDLSSRNGTWLNAGRLIPNKPYPLTSGSQIRLGKMQLRVMYHPILKDT